MHIQKNIVLIDVFSDVESKSETRSWWSPLLFRMFDFDGSD